jgi:hypothetical protein
MKGKLLSISIALFCFLPVTEVPRFQDHPPVLQTLQLNRESLHLSYQENIAELIQKINEKTILSYLQNLTKYKHRVTGTYNCEEASRYIYTIFKEMGLEVRYHNWTKDDYLFGSNIEATLRGVNPFSNEIFVICGHYDTVYSCPGADDNGIGTVSVLLAAEVMREYTFNHTIRFLTFSGEEEGLLGSLHYAEDCVRNNDNIVAALNVDMVGYTQTYEGGRKVRVFDEEFSEWLTNLTISISEVYNLDLEVVPSGSSGVSDHASFWGVGYQAIFYHEYDFNPWYHTPGDVIENMNISYATKVVKLVVATLAELAQPLTLKPPNKPEKPVGETKGKIGNKYTYKTRTRDENEDKLYYMWDWGDGTYSGWLGPYDSGEEVEAAHIWRREGNYRVKVKAKDIYNLESEWSDPLSVSIPKSQLKSLTYILRNLLKKF